jgi:hypothetical protein
VDEIEVIIGQNLYRQPTKMALTMENIEFLKTMLAEIKEGMLAKMDANHKEMVANK